MSILICEEGVAVHTRVDIGGHFGKARNCGQINCVIACTCLLHRVRIGHYFCAVVTDRGGDSEVTVILGARARKS